MPSETPGVEALARLTEVWFLYRACDASPFLPFRVSVPIEQPISSSFLLPLLPLLPAPNSQSFGHSNLTFEATYRIQLLSLHLANLSSSRNTCCWIWIRAVDYPFPEGFAPS